MRLGHTSNYVINENAPLQYVVYYQKGGTTRATFAFDNLEEAKDYAKQYRRWYICEQRLRHCVDSVLVSASHS